MFPFLKELISYLSSNDDDDIDKSIDLDLTFNLDYTFQLMLLLL